MVLECLVARYLKALFPVRFYQSFLLYIFAVFLRWPLSVLRILVEINIRLLKN